MYYFSRRTKRTEDSISRCQKHCRTRRTKDTISRCQKHCCTRRTKDTKSRCPKDCCTRRTKRTKDATSRYQKHCRTRRTKRTKDTISRCLKHCCTRRTKDTISMCKMGLTGLHNSYGSWHLYICRFLFGPSTFLSLHSCYEGHFVLFCKEKIEPLDRVMANFKRS